MRLTNKTSTSASRAASWSVSRWALALGMVAALGACASGGGSAPALTSTGGNAARISGAGPAGDYPVVLGEPYSVDGTLYTPVDTMSYDEVGYASADAAGGAGITAAHKTLPLPSYVEITSLITGKTILARVERRGPMTGDRLVSLSPGAQAQLGGADGAPVRVRRVNPPEVERAKLRIGLAAPERMETPPSLVTVLKRKLPERGSADLGFPGLARAAPSAPVPVEVPPSAAAVPLEVIAVAEVGKPVTAPVPSPIAEPAQDQAPASVPAVSAREFVVQAATFSSQASAQKIASSLGGFVMPTGKYFRVRVGPFTSRGQADAALAKVRAAGYSDARVTTAG